ncbi:hypothetical protein B0I35DRAFT_411290 [Stachybotrys elegans]|uniref:Uncharacterized protein n=1 Tax=Stachybotrys elegans TaxID=80388 RepID=A0A8K0SNJ6_9HYPO|nr:hypothetical protein B0I35DRAFT_411290 [Stachybotrys elegans]
MSASVLEHWDRLLIRYYAYKRHLSTLGLSRKYPRNQLTPDQRAEVRVWLLRPSSMNGIAPLDAFQASWTPLADPTDIDIPPYSTEYQKSVHIERSLIDKAMVTYPGIATSTTNASLTGLHFLSEGIDDIWNVEELDRMLHDHPEVNSIHPGSEIPFSPSDNVWWFQDACNAKFLTADNHRSLAKVRFMHGNLGRDKAESYLEALVESCDRGHSISALVLTPAHKTRAVYDEITENWSDILRPVVYGQDTMGYEHSVNIEALVMKSTAGYRGDAPEVILASYEDLEDLAALPSIPRLTLVLDDVDLVIEENYLKLPVENPDSPWDDLLYRFSRITSTYAGIQQLMAYILLKLYDTKDDVELDAFCTDHSFELAKIVPQASRPAENLQSSGQSDQPEPYWESSLQEAPSPELIKSELQWRTKESGVAQAALKLIRSTVKAGRRILIWVADEAVQM